MINKRMKPYTYYATDIYTPFFYIIEEIKTGMLYAGSRIAASAHPLELLNTYCTSSKTIKSIGINNFTIRKIKTFHMGKDAEEYETRFLKKVNARTNPKFYNQHNNVDLGFNNAEYISVKDLKGNYLRIKKDDERIGNEFFGVNKGKSFSDETNSKKGKGVVTIGGVKYRSLGFACNELNITRVRAKAYIKYNTTDDQIINKIFTDKRLASTNYKEIGKKISNTKNSTKWKDEVGQEATKKQIANSNYEQLGNAISDTMNSSDWKKRNTFQCEVCKQDIIGKGNLAQHLKGNH